MPIRRALFAFTCLLAAIPLFADGPADNIAEKVRPIPPLGIALPATDRAALQNASDALGQEIEALRAALATKPALLGLLPDVELYYNAVRYALAHNEFYDLNELKMAHQQLAAGTTRANDLREGKAPWTTVTGLVVRGYRSKIDGSVQPYGLVVPASYQPASPYKHRLDLWCHGRGEKLTELSFIKGRESNPGEFVPAHAFVLHLYGRYCNANKLAGEIDALEAMAHVKAHYPIDDDRVVVRGFSMGGAACWQFAVHYPTLWCAAAPGAGFSETPEFLRIFQKEDLQPTWYEKKLWHLYDCTDYAANLFNCPTVAYSGADDVQKQAADAMEAAMKREGLSLVHLIGPKTGHSYHPEAKRQLNERIDAIVRRGRDPLPRHVRFTTYTLRYNQSAWVRIDGLERHWDKAMIDAEIVDAHTVRIKTENVTDLTLAMPPGLCPLENDPRPLGSPEVQIDDSRLGHLAIAPVRSDRSWQLHLRKRPGDKAWRATDGGFEIARKRHGLQGPIDDAFLDSFLMVKPTGAPLNEKVGIWAKAEMAHAVAHWRQQFRGEARVKIDADVTDADMAAHNLVLWGDPSSNKVLAKIADKLPIRWASDGIKMGNDRFPADNHVALQICPNPLNPNRYVVLNSGFTFREYDYLNNARQVPKLPDFAIVDVRTPPSPRAPGKVVAAGFFDEEWKLPAKGE